MNCKNCNCDDSCEQFKALEAENAQLKQENYKLRKMKYNDIGSVCDDCARKAGFERKNKVCGVWVGKCEICGKKKPCTDLWHDWRKKHK